MRLAAVLLAAGQSRRFGEENKLLAPVGGMPMAARAMNLLTALNVDAVFAVVSCEEVAALARERGMHTVWNRTPECGLSGSVALGVQAAREEDADAVLLMAADQVRLTEASLRALVSGFRRSGCQAACLMDETHWGNPAVFSMALAPELLSLTGDRGAKAVLKRHEEGVLRVPCVLEGELGDADDPGALFALCGKSG